MATEARNRIQTGTPATSESADSTCETLMKHPLSAIEQAVRDQPATATMTAFGIGLGVGAVIGCMLVDRTAERRRLAASLGSRMLDSVGEYLPHSIQQRLGS